MREIHRENLCFEVRIRRRRRELERIKGEKKSYIHLFLFLYECFERKHLATMGEFHRLRESLCFKENVNRWKKKL